jgi:hypothetical protein
VAGTSGRAAARRKAPLPLVGDDGVLSEPSYLSCCRRTISVIQMGAKGDVQPGGRRVVLEHLKALTDVDRPDTVLGALDPDLSQSPSACAPATTAFSTTSSMAVWWSRSSESATAATSTANEIGRRCQGWISAVIAISRQCASQRPVLELTQIRRRYVIEADAELCA